MQTQAAAGKKLGHVRRPSYGKVTPISSLLLNLSNSSNIRHDGVSPDSSEASHIFSFGPHGPILQHQTNQVEDNVVDATTNFIEQEKFAEQIDKVEPESKPVEAIDLSNTFLKCTNYHHAGTDETINADPIIARDTDDIDKYLPNSRDKPCLICNVNAKRTTSVESTSNQPMKELCEALCNDKCKTSPVRTSISTSVPVVASNDTSGKILIRSNSSRQEFLASMLQEATTLVEAPKAVIENDKATDKIAVETAPIDVTVDGKLKGFCDSYFRDKMDVAEALAKTSMMTSPAAKRRLAARQMEMNLNNADFVYDSENSDYIPPKELLMYLVR